MKKFKEIFMNDYGMSIEDYAKKTIKVVPNAKERINELLEMGVLKEYVIQEARVIDEQEIFNALENVLTKRFANCSSLREIMSIRMQTIEIVNKITRAIAKDLLS